jgi:uncharacterized RDD family membrane protein YckC
MRDRYTVDTPESIELSYDVAGIGSRFLAAIVDSALIAGGQAVLLYLLSLATGAVAAAESVLIAAGATLSFVMLWGYYIVFELVWNGQSPGKRLVGLRVVREGGRPITFVGSAVRNLVRIVDFLPVLYGVGVVVMFVDARARRLGDLAAGTLVVHERRSVTLESLTAGIGAPASGAVTLAGVELLTEGDYRLVQDFLARRADLGADIRQRLSMQLAAGLQARLGIPQGGDAERFLQYVAEQYRIALRR